MKRKNDDFLWFLLYRWYHIETDEVIKNRILALMDCIQEPSNTRKARYESDRVALRQLMKEQEERDILNDEYRVL